jgi:hypothetical protein
MHFNKTIKNEAKISFHKHWKTSMLTPLPRKGDHEIPSNNRPL